MTYSQSGSRGLPWTRSAPETDSRSGSVCSHATESALIAARSEDAQQILDQAEVTAETLKMRLEPVLLQAREVGAALVDEATERGADILVLALAYKKRFGGDFAIGRTIPYVLKHAPCSVWVVREPMPEELQ